MTGQVFSGGQDVMGDQNTHTAASENNNKNINQSKSIWQLLQCRVDGTHAGAHDKQTDGARRNMKPYLPLNNKRAETYNIINMEINKTSSFKKMLFSSIYQVFNLINFVYQVKY